MEEIPIITDKGENIEITNYNPIQIELNETIYELNIKSEENIISLSIIDKDQFPTVKYIREMNFLEIKELNKIFSSLNSPKDFYDYFKSLSDDKKLTLRKVHDKISVILYSDISLKQQEIVINLYQMKKDVDSCLNEIYIEILNLKNGNSKLNKEIETLKNENEELKNKIEKQNQEINNLKINIDYLMNKSVIMKEDERNFIFTKIESNMCKKIKEIKKLYQATIDGGDSINFHKKCDNIPNTLVLIKSDGQRRFGGFTPIPWKSEENYKWIKDHERKTFVFSIDNKKIYDLINVNSNAIYHYKNSGPSFGGGRDIALDGNPLKQKTLYTRYVGNSFDYKNDNLALSEYDGEKKGKVLEYEVFQVIFISN